MNPEDFEKHLQQQPIRPIPGHWRASILANATAVPRPRPLGAAKRSEDGSTLDPRPSLLARFLWPHPRAWAAVAAIWIVLLSIQATLRDGSDGVRRQTDSNSGQLAQVLKQQRQLMAELIGQLPGPDAEPRKPSPARPQSRRDGHQSIG